MTRTICIYHGNCADGFAAAWAVRKALGDQVEFVPGVYGHAPPDVSGSHVIMVDFSYKRPVIEAMAAKCRTMLILDHHKTAEAELSGFVSPLVPIGSDDVSSGWDAHLVNVSNAYHHLNRETNQPLVLFDMERSGAQIAWDFFHPNQPRPRLIDYVADRDLWRFALPRSRQIAAAVFSYPYNFDTWDGLAASIDDYFDDFANEGAAIERKHHKDIDELLKVTRRDMIIGGHRVPVANLPYTLASDAAGKMAEGAPFAACYFDRPDGRVFSLRSRGDGGLDVAEIAADYGGGGHRNAAGFQMPIGWEGESAEPENAA